MDSCHEDSQNQDHFLSYLYSWGSESYGGHGQRGSSVNLSFCCSNTEQQFTGGRSSAPSQGELIFKARQQPC